MDLEALYNDLYANGYHNKFGFTHAERLILEGVIKYLNFSDIVLDVGCSTGTALGILNDYGFNVYGTDISSVAIDQAKKNGFKNVYQSNSLTLPFPDNKFNGIICTDVLEHIPEENLPVVFNNFNRVLKNDGFLFLKIALSVEKNKKYQTITNKYGLKNLHLTVKNKDYWLNYLRTNFKIIKILNDESSLEIILKK